MMSDMGRRESLVHLCRLTIGGRSLEIDDGERIDGIANGY